MEVAGIDGRRSGFANASCPGDHPDDQGRGFGEPPSFDAKGASFSPIWVRRDCAPCATDQVNPGREGRICPWRCRAWIAVPMRTPAGSRGAAADATCASRSGRLAACDGCQICRTMSFAGTSTFPGPSSVGPQQHGSTPRNERGHLPTFGRHHAAAPGASGEAPESM